MTRHPTHAHHVRTMRLAALPALLLLGLAACDTDVPPGTDPVAAPAVVNPATSDPIPPGSAQQVEARIGDTTVYAVAMLTSNIPVEVAQAHGIPRRDDLVMLRVSGRRGEVGSGVAVPLEVQAQVQRINGPTEPLEMQPVLAAGLVDYVGTHQIRLPETLRFDIAVKTPSGETGAFQLSRDFPAGL